MRARKLLPLLVVVIALSLLVGPAQRAQPVAAQEAQVLGVTGCMADVCSTSSPCSAGDTAVALVETLGMVEPCTYIGDTGTYMFRATFQSTATTRYDPAVWIALDGGDAKNGSCWWDYLIPPLQLTNTPPFPPYWDAEKNGDQCGDISSTYSVQRVIGPVTIQCKASNTGGTINTCSAYDNQAENNCPANYGCPGTGSKCKCQAVPFEVTLCKFDLSILKTSNRSSVPEGGGFDYYLTVTNETTGCTSPCDKGSSGYKITDDLPDYLKALSYFSADTGLSCNIPTGGTDWGAVVTCSTTTNLACGATAPVITLHVQAKPPVDDVCNTACVAGFEVDPVSSNDCRDVCVQTAVELMDFSATGSKHSIILRWETSSETDNLGFNLYRAKKVDGPRTRINEDLIPSLVPPGSTFGATYEYEDLTMLGARTYWYWLEAVDIYGGTALYGPIEARAKK